MRKFLIIFITAFLLINLHCSKDDVPVVNTKNKFAIYLLQNPDLKIGDILTKALADQDSTALSKIEIQNLPWLTDDDIEFYDFSSHLVYLKQDKSHFLPPRVGLGYPSSWWNKPFVVVANGRKRYVGVFRSSVSPDNWPLPEINDFFNYTSYPSDLLIIQWGWFPSSDFNDSRNDPYVKEALLKANILHEGIKLKLNKIIFTENSDTATVEYTYTIKNNDLSNLYVINPEKMGSALFHSYINGPSFLKSDESSTRESTLKKVVNPQVGESQIQDWVTKINSGDSITRTVHLKGYSFFPPGIYYCELFFQFGNKISKDLRVLPDGRYWIGQTVSDVIAIQY